MKHLVLYSALILFFTFSANATLITFDELEISGNDSYRLSVYTHDNYELTTLETSFALWKQDNPNYSMSASLFINSVPNKAVLKTVDGSSFNFESITLRPLYDNTTGIRTMFWAYNENDELIDYWSISESMSNLPSGYWEVSLPSFFSGIYKAEWGQISNGYHQFDNIQLSNSEVASPKVSILFVLSLIALVYRFSSAANAIDPIN